MIRRILVPLDGSPGSEAILPQVVRVVRRTRSEVLLVRAEHPIVTENYALIAEAALGGAGEYLSAIETRLAPHRLRIRSFARIGSPTEMILRIAREERVSMIALATHGRSGLSRLILGSVAEQVIRRSPVPVFAVRPFCSYEITPLGGPEEAPVRRILVPVDGSGLDQAAVPEALEFSKLFEARVVLLHVLPPTLDRDAPGSEGELDTVRSALREIAFGLSARGVPTLTLIEEGDPASRILGIGRAQGVDLIVMATHGRRGFSRFLSGSVTEKVLREATVPLMIVNEARLPRRRASAARRSGS